MQQINEPPADLTITPKLVAKNNNYFPRFCVFTELLSVVLAQGLLCSYGQRIELESSESSLSHMSGAQAVKFQTLGTETAAIPQTSLFLHGLFMRFLQYGGFNKVAGLTMSQLKGCSVITLRKLYHLLCRGLKGSGNLCGAEKYHNYCCSIQSATPRNHKGINKLKCNPSRLENKVHLSAGNRWSQRQE